MTKWKTPFRRLLKYLEEADGLLVLCMQGIGAISKMVPLAKALMDQSPDIDLDQKEKSINEARKRAELSQSEIDKGFPLFMQILLLALGEHLNLRSLIF